MAVMLEVALLSTATRIWGGLYGFLGDDPILAAVVLLCLALVLAAFLLWIRHWRSEARRLKAFMDPLKRLRGARLISAVEAHSPG